MADLTGRPATTAPGPDPASRPTPSVALLHAHGDDPFGEAVARRVTLEGLQHRLGPGIVVRPVQLTSATARSDWADAMPAEPVDGDRPVALSGVGCVVVGPGPVDASTRAALPAPDDATPPVVWHAVGPIRGLDGPHARGDLKDALRRLEHVTTTDAGTALADLGVVAPSVADPLVLAPELVPRSAAKRLAWMRVVGWLPAADPLVVDADLAGEPWAEVVAALARHVEAPVVVVDLRGHGPAHRVEVPDVGGEHIGRAVEPAVRRLPGAATLDDVLALFGACRGVVTASPGAARVACAHGRRAVLVPLGAPVDLVARWTTAPDDAVTDVDRARAAADLDALAEHVVADLRASDPAVPTSVARLQHELVSLRTAFDARGHQLLTERQLFADRVGEAVARLEDARRWYESELRRHHEQVAGMRDRAEAAVERELASLRRQVDNERGLRTLQVQHFGRAEETIAALRAELDQLRAAGAVERHPDERAADERAPDEPVADEPVADEPVHTSARRVARGAHRAAGAARRVPGGSRVVSLAARIARRGRHAVRAARTRG
jgi:hypothetical protein